MTLKKHINRGFNRQETHRDFGKVTEKDDNRDKQLNVETIVPVKTPAASDSGE